MLQKQDKKQKKKLTKKDKLQIEFQKGIEKQIRIERQQEFEDAQNDPVVLPSYRELYKMKRQDPNNATYKNLKFVDIQQFNQDAGEFQQIYAYPSKELTNPSQQPSFDVANQLDLNLFVPPRGIGIRDLMIFLQK